MIYYYSESINYNHLSYHTFRFIKIISKRFSNFTLVGAHLWYWLIIAHSAGCKVWWAHIGNIRIVSVVLYRVSLVGGNTWHIGWRVMQSCQSFTFWRHILFMDNMSVNCNFKWFLRGLGYLHVLISICDSRLSRKVPWEGRFKKRIFHSPCQKDILIFFDIILEFDIFLIEPIPFPFFIPQGVSFFIEIMGEFFVFPLQFLNFRFIHPYFFSVFGLGIKDISMVSYFIINFLQ